MSSKIRKIGFLLVKLPQLVLGAFLSLHFMHSVVAQEALVNYVPNEIHGIMKKSPIPQDGMSIWVAPVDGGSPVVNWQSDVLRKPASVAKAITTGMGLLLLGDNFRWRTEFFTNGLLEGGTLKGDLFIKGYGNPYLVEEDLLGMVVELRELGINHLAGQIVLDNSYFIHDADNPEEFDGYGMAAYNALPDALNINFRTTKLIFDADSEGVHVSTEPELTYLHINNQMTHSKNKGCRGKGFAPKLSIDRATQTLTILGTMSRRCDHKELVRVIADAGDLFYGHFKSAWQKTGGTMDDGWMYGSRSGKANMIYVGQSQPLYEQIAAMNKHSNNVMTRQLFLTIGAVLAQPPATLAKSRAVINNYLMEMGLDMSQFFIDNGAGLSRESRMSASQLGRFLQLIGNDAQAAPFFEQSLSVVGVDGTLRKRLRNTPLAGNAVGKTGTLDGVKSLVGYLTAQSGRKFVYVVMLEGRRAKAGRPLMDDIMLWTYYNQ